MTPGNSTPDDWVGREISHYRVIGRLGAGGMGEVYRAEDLRLGRLVALKRLKPEFTGQAVAHRRFATEARAVARLNHPHITAVYDFDAEQGFMILELVEGESLEAVQARGSLSPADALRAGLAVARALEHAHARDVVHRDVKPSNILVDAAGTVKLTDFGLARLRDRTAHTATGLVVGTADYMSPEQVRGGVVDGRSDLWSLGVVLYRALAGRLPWNGEGPAILYSILHQTPAPLDPLVPGLPAGLAVLVDRLLQKDPSVRLGSAAELVEALTRLARRAGGEIDAGPPVPADAAAGAGDAGPRASPARPAAPDRAEPSGAPESADPRSFSGIGRRLEAPLLGRETELRRLLDVLEIARLGSGRTVLLDGEAGVGKSRLMGELAAAAAASGVLTLRGSCAFQEARYFAPFVEALEELASHERDRTPAGTSEGTPDAAAGEERAGPIPSARAALELLARPDGAGAPLPRSREQVWVLVDALLKEVARAAPVLLCLEDLHWADEGTLSLLLHITRNIAPSRLMIVAAFRPEELLREEEREPPLADLLHLISPLETALRLSLGGLSRAATEALVAAALPDLPRARELAPSIHARSQGNPLFTLEILHELAGSGSPSGAGVAPADSTFLPRTVLDVLLRRIQRLSPEDRDLLELAAVEGDAFEFDLLVTGSGLPRMALLRRLRQLNQRHQLIEPVGEGYRFRHQLMREVLLKEMPADLRREYHSIVADHHLKRFGERVDVAGRAGYHLYEAGRTDEAIPHLVRAAENARRLFLFDKALLLVNQALTALERGGDREAGPAVASSRLHRERCDLLLLLGRPDEAEPAAARALKEAERLADPFERAAAHQRLGEVALARGDHSGAADHLETAQATYATAGDRTETARCLQRLGTLACRRGEYARARAHYALALEQWSGPDDAIARAGVHLEEGEVLALVGDPAGAEALFERAIDVYRQRGDRSGLVRGLIHSANLHFQGGGTASSLQRYREASALAAEIGDVQISARCLANLGNVWLVTGDLEQARGSYQAARKRFEEIGDLRGTAAALLAEGNVHHTEGHFVEAAALYARAIPPRTRMGDRWGLANVLDNLSVAEYYLGRWGEALAHARAALDIRRQLGDRPGCAESCVNLGNLLALLGDAAGAAASYGEAEALAQETGNRRKLAATGLAQACAALWSSDHARALELVERVEDLGLEEPALQVRGWVYAALARPGDTGDGMVERLRRGAALAAAAGSLPTRMLAELALARLLAGEGRPEAAARLLTELRASLTEHPIPLLELECHRIGAEAGLPGYGPEGEERSRAILRALTANLPEGWGPEPRFHTRAFPLP